MAKNPSGGAPAGSIFSGVCFGKFPIAAVAILCASGEAWGQSPPGAWTSTGALVTARYEHTATLLPNGEVLLAGGTTSFSRVPLPNAELYDPLTGAWTATAPMAAARTDQTATLLPSGKVLVAGGYGSGLAALASGS